MTQLHYEKPSKAGHRESLRRWRSLQGFGGLAVATCFFLPNIEICSSPFVPAIEVFGDLQFALPSISSISLGDRIWEAMIVLPYVIGLTIAITSIRYRHYRAGFERTLGRSVHVLLAGWTLVFLALMLGVLQPSWDLVEAPLIGWAIAAVFYCCMAALRGTVGRLCARWFSSVCLVFWFTYWIVASITEGGRTYFGVWLALAGSFLIFLDTWAEATIGGVVGWRSALRRLTTCSMQVQFLDDDRCSQCGYLLIGLTSNRCPECGRPTNQELDNPKLPFAFVEDDEH